LGALIATILSAQCTDKQVNKVTPVLFKKYNSPAKLGEAKLDDIEKIIYPTGFYKNKAVSIKEASNYIARNWNGKLRENITDLIKLRGVGRKTANVVLFNALRVTEGIAIDTHVIRITNLLKFTNTKNPQIIEKELMRITDKRYWGKITHFFINHGREICIANKPKCKQCSISKYCPSRREDI
jgi:endonuclease III